MPVHDKPAKPSTQKSTISRTEPDAQPSFHEMMETLGQQDKIHTRTRPAATAQPTPKPKIRTAALNSDDIQHARKVALHRANHPICDTYKKSGLQDREMLRLKQGKIPPADSIDLHGNIAEKALTELATFIQRSRKNNLRCVLIICGKGLHSQDGKAVLRDVIRSWLIAYSGTLAYCPAKNKDGGSGALYVILKAARIT